MALRKFFIKNMKKSSIKKSESKRKSDNISTEITENINAKVTLLILFVMETMNIIILFRNRYIIGDEIYEEKLTFLSI